MLSAPEEIKKKGEEREGEPLRETTGWVSTDKTRQDNYTKVVPTTMMHTRGVREKRELIMRFSLYTP